MDTQIKIPVTHRAVIARIRRKLAKELKTFHICTTDNHATQLGRYYVADNNFWQWGNSDLEEMARDLDCLKDMECLAEWNV